MKLFVYIFLCFFLIASCSVIDKSIRCSDGKGLKTKNYRVKKNKNSRAYSAYAGGGSSSSRSASKPPSNSPKSSPEPETEQAKADPIETVPAPKPELDNTVTAQIDPIDPFDDRVKPDADPVTGISRNPRLPQSTPTINSPNEEILDNEPNEADKLKGINRTPRLSSSTPTISSPKGEDEITDKEPNEVDKLEGINRTPRLSSSTPTIHSPNNSEESEIEDPTNADPLKGITRTPRLTAQVNPNLQLFGNAADELDQSDANPITGISRSPRLNTDVSINLSKIDKEATDEKNPNEADLLTGVELSQKLETEIEIDFDPLTQLVFNNRVYEKDEDIEYQDKIQFIPNYDVIKNEPESYAKLEKLANLLKEYPDKKVRIIASGGWDVETEMDSPNYQLHPFTGSRIPIIYGRGTDVYAQTIFVGLEKGSDDYNRIKELGLRNVNKIVVGDLFADRNNTVRDILVDYFGVNKSQVKAGLGEFTRVNDHMLKFKIY